MADKKNGSGKITKELITVDDIREGAVVLKDRILLSIIEVTPINFDLKSDQEQTATIQAFQNFINSLDFSAQILISSRVLDINSYLKVLDELIQKQESELVRIQAIEYSRFVKGLAELANIMVKKFYLVVPYYVPVQLKGKSGLFNLKSLWGKKGATEKLSDDEFQNYKSQLDQRVSVVLSGISAMGLEGSPLDKEKLLPFLYSFYNPGHVL